jgi:CrcB protein
MEELRQMLIVALGGAVGSVARYRLSGWVLHYAIDWRFPLGTFVVNVMGCLCVGLLAGLAVKEDFFSADARLLLFTGLMGGFTTFSAFGLETFYLLRRGEYLIAGSNMVLSMALGMLALFAGYQLIASRWPAAA